MDAEIFVERRFGLGNEEVVACFHAPTLAPGGEYQCRWRIKWPHQEQRHYASGIDGVQALMLAMRTVHSELVQTEAYQSGKLTYLKQRDLDLPPTWSAGPLCEAGPKVD